MHLIIIARILGVIGVSTHLPIDCLWVIVYWRLLVILIACVNWLRILVVREEVVSLVDWILVSLDLGVIRVSLVLRVIQAWLSLRVIRVPLMIVLCRVVLVGIVLWMADIMRLLLLVTVLVVTILMCEYI